MLISQVVSPQADPISPQADTAVTPVAAIQNVPLTHVTLVAHAPPPGGTVNTDAPDLPDVEGPKASPAQLRRVVTGGSLPTNAGAMAWAAMESMTASAQQEFSQQAKVKREAETQKIAAKSQEITDTKTQIAGQREQSVNLLMGSVVAAVGSFAIGAGGAALSFGTDGLKMAAGAGLNAMGQASGQMINNAAQATDKLAGGGREADDASIAIKIDQKDEDIAQQVADSANSLLQNAQQEWQKAQQAITDMNDRRMQASNQIANS